MGNRYQTRYIEWRFSRISHYPVPTPSQTAYFIFIFNKRPRNLNLHYRRFQKCIKGAQIKRVRIYRFRLWGWLNQETLFFLVMVVEMRPTHPPRRQRMHNFCVEDRIDYIAVCGDGFLSSLLELLYSLDRLVRRRA